MLYPFEYKTESVSCPDGSQSSTEAECFTAATAAMALGAEPHFDRPDDKAVSAGSWNNRPKGCIVDVSNSRVSYNNHATGGSSTNYKAVCSTSAFPAAANFSAIGGSGRLCPHKRATCQTTPSAGRGCLGNYGGSSDTLHASYWWSEEPCRVQVQVAIDGRASRVDHGARGADPQSARLQPNSDNWFRVRWPNGNFPTAATGCADSCVVQSNPQGATCLCDVSVATKVAFTDTAALPSHAQLEETLSIGAPPPGHFDAGTYTECTVDACTAAGPAVRLFTKGTANSPLLDETAIFAIIVNHTGVSATSGHTLYLANKASMVSIAHDGNDAYYTFRNPPQMMTLIDSTQRDAIYESEALLEHLFYHQNVGPFVGYRLIQHLVTSNPSPRYVRAVTEAFNSGSYAGRTYSGRYGDMGAMMAAIMLDREARSLVLTADPTHGHVREPLTKLLHLMRSLEISINGDRELELSQYIKQKIGQGVYQAGTVFNFYSPEYSPSGPVSNVGLVAPEAQLGVLPNVIGFMDGINAMLFDGLSSCGPGLFTAACKNSLYTYPAAWNNADFSATNDGYLAWTPADASAAESVIDELNLLLTAGRLDTYAREVVLEEYNHAIARSACPVDKSGAFCGHLKPGQELLAGEHIVNSNGETLCMTYDGVARHIGADGREFFSTAVKTRERGVRFTYDSDGVTYVRAEKSDYYWRSSNYEMGNDKAFHSFLRGPCELHDTAAYERYTKYAMSPLGAVATSISCNAADTCSSPSTSPSSPAYLAERARTDASYAIRMAQSLIASSAAFSATGDPLTNAAVEAHTVPSVVSQGRPYKALIVFFMRGGADTFNLLVPSDDCDSRNVRQQYLDTRTSAALTSHLDIAVPAGTQPCGKFGLHPEMTTLQQLYNDGDAAMIANMGAMLYPTTKEQYRENRVELPPQLFAHNTQQKGAESVHSQEAFADGVVGRLLNEMDDQAVATGYPQYKTAGYAITSHNYLFRGMKTEPVMLTASEGMLTYQGSGTSSKADNIIERNRTLTAIRRIVGREAGSVFAETHNSIVRTALADSERISGQLSQVTLTQDWQRASNSVGESDLVDQLHQVSRVIASHTAMEAERDVFLVEMGGFDYHKDLMGVRDLRFAGINKAFETFAAEMKAQGVWDQTTVFGLSEFGRTMTTNGGGTDHAWGGNYFVFGGDVRGGTIHGNFPELRTDGPNSISATGQMLPGSPWEAIWSPLASWMGVNDDHMSEVLPNVGNFDAQHIFDRNAVFKSSA